MSKHQEILDYLKELQIGKRVSVRSISNHLKVSEGTAYRAIKEAENRGLVETRPRSGTIRVDKRLKVRMDHLTFQEIAEISESDVIAGHAGLIYEFSKFSIGAMTLDSVERHLTPGGLMIVGDRENVQLLALKHRNAILVTGGFKVSERVKKLADANGIPVLVTAFDTFTVATMINDALSDVRIKTDIKTVEQVYALKNDYGFLEETSTVRDFNQLSKRTNRVRFPVVNQHGMVVGVISIRDVSQKDQTAVLDKLMTKNPMVTKPNISLANVNQKMILEDYDMLPVINDNYILLGVITRRQVMENLQDLTKDGVHTITEQIISLIGEERDHYTYRVEPTMIDMTGNFSASVLTDIIKEVTIKELTKKHHVNIAIEQLSLYFIQAIQIDDAIKIYPKIVSITRKSATVDIEVFKDYNIVYKAIVITKIN